MPEFRYVARNSEGKLIEGVLSCPDRAAAIHQVERERAVPIRINPVQAAPAPTPAAPKPAAQPPPTAQSSRASEPATEVLTPVKTDRLGHNQLYLFTEQLAHLLTAGMTLDEGLGIMVRRLKHARLGGLAKALHQSLVEGRSLSQAMREYPLIFSSLYANMVAAGEASGALPDILKRLVRHLAGIKALRDKVQQALVYPALLVLVGAALIVVFIKVMVPQLMGFFAKTGQALPLPTRILLEINRLLTSYGWVALLAGAALYFAFKAFTNSPEGRKSWDTLVWKLPVFSGILRYRYYAQFARTLGTLMENGVTLLRSLELLEEISGNLYVRDRMTAVRKAVMDGATMSVALGEQQLFPELFIDMMAVGEQAGKFGQTMGMIADVYERELDKQVQITTSLVPPVVMLGIAAVVGLVVYGILSAVFSLTSGLR
jgi:type II secretory pathway component PulF